MTTSDGTIDAAVPPAGTPNRASTNAALKSIRDDAELAAANAVARIAGSTYSTIQHMQDIFHSAGVTSGGGITDDADGTITVAAGTGLIRATDSVVAELLFTDWAAEAGANVALVDNDMNYIYVEYNAGSPQVIASITARTDNNTNIFLGTVYREGTTLHPTTFTAPAVGDHALQMILRINDTAPFAHVSGGMLSEVGTRNIAVTAGNWWGGLTPFNTAALDTSVAGTFVYYYDDGASGWTAVAAQTQIDNLQYDDGSGTLATLSNNRYGVHWIYISQEGDYYGVYGTVDGTLAVAEASGAPASVPPEFAESHARLIGKIVILKSAASFTTAQSVFTEDLALGTATDHGDLIGLSDDDHAIYIKADGTRAFSGNADFGNNQIINAVLATDAIEGPVELATDAETITGTDPSRVVPVSALTAKLNDGAIEGTDAEIIVYNAAVPAAVPVSGDITADNTGAFTIGASKVLLSMINATTVLGKALIAVRHKFDATTAPTVNDDVTGDYGPGSFWGDETNDKAYVCLDGTAGAAVWTEITGAGSGIANIVEDTTPQLGGALDGQGFDLNNMGVAFLTEQAAAEADVAGKGQIWVKTATPNVLMFTDDAGTDFQMPDGSLSGTVNQIVLFNSTPAPVAVTMSGDGNILASGAFAIGAGKVTLTMLNDGTTAKIQSVEALAGAVVGTTDAQTLTQKNMQDYSVESAVLSSGATITADYTDGPDFTVTLGNGDTSTLAFSNWPASGTLGKITLQATQNGTGASTLAFTNVDVWPGGTVPTMTATLNAVDEYVFWTRDGGTTVYGAAIGQAFA